MQIWVVMMDVATDDPEVVYVGTDHSGAESTAQAIRIAGTAGRRVWVQAVVSPEHAREGILERAAEEYRHDERPT